MGGVGASIVSHLIGGIQLLWQGENCSVSVKKTVNDQKGLRENKETHTKTDRDCVRCLWLYCAEFVCVCVCEEAEAVVCVSDVLTAQMVEWSLLRYCHQLSSEGGVCVHVCVHFCGWLRRSCVKTNTFQAH